MRCRLMSRRKIQDKWRIEIIKFLLEPHTPRAIRDALCHGLFSWLESGRNTWDIPTLPRRKIAK
jgi:hypothetical protein